MSKLIILNGRSISINVSSLVQHSFIMPFIILFSQVFYCGEISFNSAGNKYTWHSLQLLIKNVQNLHATKINFGCVWYTFSTRYWS